MDTGPKNILLPSLSKRKCVGLSLVNRVPEADFESKMYEIRKDYAKFKEETRIEEGKMWDELYQNHKDLRKSFVSRYSLDEVLTNKDATFLPRVTSLPYDNTTSLPFAEAYKQFVIFKANTMLQMRLKPVEKRPTYSTLYAKEHYNKNRNQNSFQKVLMKYESKGRSDQSVMALLNNTSTEGNGNNVNNMSRSNSTDGKSSRTINNHVSMPTRAKTQDDFSSRNRKISVVQLPRLVTIANEPNMI